MIYRFHLDAEAEFIEAVDYFETFGNGRGQVFAADVYETIKRILDHPLVWPKLDGETRRCQTKHFPYGVVYAVEPNEVLILAVMHLRRNPDYWKLRSRR